MSLLDNTPHEFTTQTEQQVREHFGEALPPDSIIERIPYSTIWALSDGTLLWDKTNGYANLNRIVVPVPELKNRLGYGASSSTPVVQVIPNKKVDRLETIIYLTGPAASGKTTLIELMANALEVNRHNYISFTDLSRGLENKKHYTTLVVTDQLNDLSYSRILKQWAEKKDLRFYAINLKQN